MLHNPTVAKLIQKCVWSWSVKCTAKKNLPPRTASSQRRLSYLAAGRHWRRAPPEAALVLQSDRY